MGTTKRSQRAQHPNSLANLKKGQRLPDYDAGAKRPVSVGLTPEAKLNLVALAESKGVSLSELVERIGRSLSEEKLEKLLS